MCATCGEMLSCNGPTVHRPACSSVFPGLSGAWTARLPRGVKRCAASEPFLSRCLRLPLQAGRKELRKPQTSGEDDFTVRQERVNSAVKGGEGGIWICDFLLSAFPLREGKCSSAAEPVSAQRESFQLQRRRLHDIILSDGPRCDDLCNIFISQYSVASQIIDIIILTHSPEILWIKKTLLCSLGVKQKAFRLHRLERLLWYFHLV